MKREILCTECAPWIAAAFESPLPTRLALVDLDHDERFRLELGPLLVAIRCDHCNRDLAPGVEAWCVSLWSVSVGIPWSRWEPDYISTHGSEP